MEKIWLHGDFSNTPFAFLLLRIWKSRRTGRLKVKLDEKELDVNFRGGEICVTSDSISRDNLVKISREILGAEAPEALTKKDKSNRDSIPPLRVLHESDRISPPEIWKALDAFKKKELEPLFDLEKAEYFFDSEQSRRENEILFFISSLNTILMGTRGMRSHSFVETHLPPPAEKIILLHPKHASGIALNPTEVYLIHLLESETNRNSLNQASVLGERENNRILFSFLSLGLITSASSRDKSATSDFSQADWMRTLEAFNRKSQAVYKYITKEIGPAALNILEKCMQETKPNLSAFLQNIRFTPEGKIEPGPVMKAGPSMPGEDTRRILLNDLNELLAAEILAVKKTLGIEHESALIRILKKDGT